MKKFFSLLVASMWAIALSAASYGIMINGSDFHQATANPSPADPSFQEYMALDVQVPAGATLQLYDNENKAGWAVDLDKASVAGIVRDGDHYTCADGGCFSFYIKLKFQADQLYIGNGTCTGGGDPNPGGNDPVVTPPSGNEGNPRYYYKGYIDGRDVEPGDDTYPNRFYGGTASLTVAQDAYIFVLYQVDGVAGQQYMTTSYVDGPTHATLVTNGSQKFHLVAGSYTLYLYDNGDGSLEISTQPIAGKKLADPDGEANAVENVAASATITKAIVNGQLVIIRDGISYSATGARL